MLTNLFALKFLAVQVLERLLRIDRFLNAAMREAPGSGTRIVSTLRAYAQRIRYDLFDTMRDFKGQSEEPSFSAGVTLLTDLGTHFNSFQDVHLRLSYVSRGLRNAQLELFVKAVFEEPASRHGRQASVSVVPSDSYEFEEINLDEALSPGTNGDTPTLFLPKIEFDNPLHWNPLVHEFGHTLTDVASPILQQITGPNPTQVQKRWFSETFCDLLAVRLLGPAYMASLTDFMVGTAADDFVEKVTDTHPDDRFRVTAIRELLRRDGVALGQGVIPDLAEFCYRLFEARARVERTYLRIQPKRRPPIDDVLRLRHAVMDSLGEVVPSSLADEALDTARLVELSRRLRDGIPIGCIPAMPKDMAAVDAATSRLGTLSREQARSTFLGRMQSRDDSGSDPDEASFEANLQILREAVRERPCTVSEILNAGWLYKWTDIYIPVIQNIDALEDKKNLEQFAGEIFKLDDVIRTSIEVAYLAKKFEPHFNRSHEEETL